MRHRSPGATVYVILAMLVVLLGGGAALVRTTRSSPARTHDDSLQLANSRFGRILVTARGSTLYLFTRDPRGKSTCVDVCARVWPPATVRAKPTAGPGVAVTKLSTLTRRDSTMQLVYAGHPLYTFSGDNRRGD